MTDTSKPSKSFLYLYIKKKFIVINTELNIFARFEVKSTGEDTPYPAENSSSTQSGGVESKAHTKGHQSKKSHRTWRGSWMCVEGLVRSAGQCLYWDFQLVTITLCQSETNHHQCKWLSASSTHSSGHEVFWKTGTESHHIILAARLWPTSICIQRK